MSDMEIVETGVQPDWKPRAIIIGAALGAAVGAAAAYLFIQNAANDDGVDITPGEGIKLGLLVFGLLRSVANLGEE